MKKFLLTLAAIGGFGLQIAFAQTYQLDLSGTDIFKSGLIRAQFLEGDTLGTYTPNYQLDFSYNVTANSQTGVYTTFDQGLATIHNRKTAIYDQAGRMIEFSTDVYSNNAWVFLTRNEHQYDSYGNQTRFAVVDSSGSIQEDISTWTYVNNRPVMVHTNYRGNASSLQMRFNYDGSGELDTLWTENILDSTGQVTPLLRRTYSWHNFNSKKASSIYEETYDGAGFTFYSQHDLSYDSNDTLRQAVKYTSSSQGGIAIDRLWKYDSEGFIELDSVVYWSAGIPSPIYTGSSIYTYQFNQGYRSQMDVHFLNLLGENSNFRREIYTYPATAAEDALLPIEASIFPNPAQSQLHIRLPEHYQGNAQFQLFDLGGRLRMELNTPVFGEQIDIQLSDLLENGTYILQMSSAKGIARQKVQILH